MIDAGALVTAVIGFFGVAITAGAGILVALVTVWGKLREVALTSSEVRDQVANSHDTNLRDDIDDVSAAVRDLRDHLRDIRTAATAEHEALWAAITKGRQGDLPTGSIPTITDTESAP